MRGTRHRAASSLVVALVSASEAACGRPAPEPRAPEHAVAAAAPVDGPALYRQRCEMCHAANGEGFPGTHPPLARSDLAAARDAGVPIRILLLGMQGERVIRGTRYGTPMPRYGTGLDMTDAEGAAVLTYVRRSWGNDANAVAADDVARVRAALGADAEAATLATLAPLLDR